MPALDKAKITSAIPDSIKMAFGYLSMNTALTSSRSSCVGAGPSRRRRIADRQVMLRVESNPPPRHRRDSSNARTPLATVVADALVDVRLEGVLTIRHFFLRARCAGAVVEVQGHASQRRRAVTKLRSRRRRAGHVQCCCAAVLGCCCSGCDEALRSDCDTAVSEMQYFSRVKSAARRRIGDERQGRELAAVRH